MKALSSTPTNLIGAVSYSGGGTYTLTGLTVGQNYLFTKGANDTSCTVTTTTLVLAASGVFTATGTSVVLAGTPAASVTASVSLCQPVQLHAATVTPTLPARQITIGQFPASNPNFSRQIQISDQYVFVKRGTAAVAISLPDLVNLALTQETGLTWTPPVVLTQVAAAACAATAAATGTLTSDNTNVSDGDTVTIGSKTYTFKTALTPTEGQVLIGGSADASLLNLIRAINHTGTPDTDYKCAAANTQVSAAASVTSHAFVVTAITSGLAGNAIATTETSGHLSWGAAALTGGTVDPAEFSFEPGSEYTLTYQWQYSQDGLTGWTNCAGTVNGCAYSGGTTATLTCTPTTTGQTGYYHRCVVTDDAASYGVASNGVLTSQYKALTIP